MGKKTTKLLNALRKNRRSIIITSAAGIIIFSTLILLVWNYILSSEKDIFRYQSDIIQERIIGDIIAGETVANSIIALYYSSEYVSRKEFRVFMNEIFKRYGFIKSVYYYEKRGKGRAYELLHTETHDSGKGQTIGSLLTASSFNNSVRDAISTGLPIIVKDDSAGKIYIIISEYGNIILPEKILDREKFSKGVIILEISLQEMILQHRIPEECSAVLKLFDYSRPDKSFILFTAGKYPVGDNDSDIFALMDLQYNYMTKIAAQSFELLISKSVTFSMMHFMSFFFVIIIGFLLTAGINTITRKSTRIREQNDDLVEIGDFLTGILNSMSSMLITVNRDFSITHWNSAAEKFTGIQTPDAMSQNVMDIIGFLQPFRDKILLCMNNNRSETLNHEDVHTGKRRFFNISVFPMTYHKIPGAILMIDDVSELRIIDNELKQIQKMETIGNLAGGLAHDLNNIIGGIYGVTDVLKFKYSSNIKVETADIKKFLDIIENQSRRAAGITDHLLSIAQKSELNLSTIDLTRTVSDVLELCRSSFDKRIEILFNSDDSARYILADVTQISQVLLNICINANHAMTTMKPEGERYGGRLTVSIDLFHADIRFRTLHPADSYFSYYWIVSLSDDGVGIDSQIIEKIFDPFYTTKSKNGGSGLGLSMVYSIIRQHNGFIDVYSEKGHGSTFNIYIPAVKTEGVPYDAQGKSQLLPCEGLILIVDDEDIMRNVAKSGLEGYGYNVLQASDGIEGLKLFKEKYNEISAVLLDMVMPKMSGIEAYMEMIKIDSNARVLLSSGFNKNEIIENFIKEPNTGFIRKPYSIEKLISEIQKISKRL